MVVLRSHSPRFTAAWPRVSVTVLLGMIGRPKALQAKIQRVSAGDGVILRGENPEERRAVRSLREAAFGRPDEADLIDRLRNEAVCQRTQHFPRNGAKLSGRNARSMRVSPLNQRQIDRCHDLVRRQLQNEKSS
jgi:hypothetical protein